MTQGFFVPLCWRVMHVYLGKPFEKTLVSLSKLDHPVDNHTFACLNTNKPITQVPVNCNRAAWRIAAALVCQRCLFFWYGKRLNAFLFCFVCLLACSWVCAHFLCAHIYLLTPTNSKPKNQVNLRKMLPKQKKGITGHSAYPCSPAVCEPEGFK